MVASEVLLTVADRAATLEGLEEFVLGPSDGWRCSQDQHDEAGYKWLQVVLWLPHV